MAGHIVAIVGGKGGVGKSVFAANLAISYQQNMKDRPLIIDLDLNSLGDLNTILGKNPSKNIVDVSKMPPGPIDPKTLAPFLINDPAGYSYIAAPRDAIIARDLNIEGLGRFLKAITNIFNLVIIDCGDINEVHAMKVLEFSTAMFVVMSPDVIVVNQTKRVLSKIQEYLFPMEMVQVIVNKYSKSSLIHPQLIQKNINLPLFGVVPEDVMACESALSKSTPVCLAAPNTPIARAYGDLVRKMAQMRLLDQLSQVKKPSGVAAKLQALKTAPVPETAAAAAGGGHSRSKSVALDPWTAMKMRIHKALVEKMDLKKTNTDTSDPKQMAVLREKTQKAVLDILTTEDTSGVLTDRDLKAQMVKEVLDEALGLGPLEDLLADDTVSEIMVNARDQIYIERSGKNQLSKVTFTSELQMMNVVERIVTPLGRRVDEKVPFVDARLGDGSRVHVIIPPLALRGPTITIRKFPKKRLTIQDYINWGSMTPEIADFLRACVEAKLNIIIAGGTGTGKTSLLNVMSNFIPATDRIITVEDAAELQLNQEHVVRLEARPKNIEGEGEVSIRDLVKCCLRMKPDRIVVGECRDGAALDMLQAMNTGHDGSMTTVHANSPRESLQRLETLVMMAGLGLPSKAIKETVASAVHLLIQLNRLQDGSRKVTYITEVTGMQGDVIGLQDVFYFKQEGLDKKRKILGRFVPTGFIPKFVEDMEQKGMRISRGLFAVK